MPTRRDFLATLGGAALGATALARALEAQVVGDVLPAIGIQLYTLRSLTSRNLNGTLERVAQIGYREVEFAGYFGRTPQQIRALLQANKLTSPSTHIGMPATDDAWKKTLDDASAMGHAWVVLPWLDAGMRKTPDDWQRAAERFNKLGEAAKQSGLRFAYHNHDFELARVADGTGLDILISRTDPTVVDFEMDIYWVVKGGGDPLDYIKRHPRRFPLLHVKDATAAPERKMADVGSGTIDFAQIFARGKVSGMRHVFVEHDLPANAILSATSSYKHLAALKY